jgi:hypothetical protein
MNIPYKVSVPYKIVRVVERFKDPENRVPRERLSCGHVRTDPELHYGDETAFRIRRMAEQFTGDLEAGRVRARCYKCAKNPVDVS